MRTGVASPDWVICEAKMLSAPWWWCWWMFSTVTKMSGSTTIRPKPRYVRFWERSLRSSQR